MRGLNRWEMACWRMAGLEWDEIAQRADLSEWAARHAVMTCVAAAYSRLAAYPEYPITVQAVYRFTFAERLMFQREVARLYEQDKAESCNSATAASI
jgi:hypothetical protein